MKWFMCIAKIGGVISWTRDAVRVCRIKCVVLWRIYHGGEVVAPLNPERKGVLGILEEFLKIRVEFIIKLDTLKCDV